VPGPGHVNVNSEWDKSTIS
jgi:hypothetical protein